MFNEYIPIEDMDAKGLFQRIVLRNIQFALVSLNHIFNFAVLYDEDVYGSPNLYYFYHLQNTLTSCGHICNVFYNRANPITQKRAGMLRDLYGFKPKEYPLIFQKEARNTNEHFDERFDDKDYMIGDYNIIDYATPEDIEKEIFGTPHLRTLDVRNMIYYSYNRKWEPIEYDLNKLKDELIQLRDTICERG